VGSMDHPVWWDEEAAAVAAHCTKCTLTARSPYRYAVKQYFYKITKIAYLKIFTYIIEMMYSIHSS
jgi:hypothetical protein